MYRKRETFKKNVNDKLSMKGLNDHEQNER